MSCNIIESFWFGVVAAASVGVIDLVEFVAFNPAVFYVHNFPDVVPDIPQGKFAAFWSGWRAAWFLYVPERLVLGLFGFCAPSVSCLYFAAVCLLLMIYDRATSQHIKKDMFYYHKWFYMFGAAVEVGWIVHALL